MAVVTARTMVDTNERKKTIHPLFGKPNSSNPASTSPSDLPHTARPGTAEPSTHTPPSASLDNVRDDVWPTPLEPHPGQYEGAVLPTTTHQNSEGMESDLNESRRKRRKTIPPEDNSGRNYHSKLENAATSRGSNGTLSPCYGALGEALHNVPGGLGFENAHGAPFQTHGFEGQADSNLNTLEAIRPNTINTIANGEQATSEPVGKLMELITCNEKPKKILHFNIKTGTIGSPPKRSIKDQAPSKGRKNRKSLVITLKYGSDTGTRLSVGNKIDHILSATKPIQAPPKQKFEVEARPVKANISKSPHPFFLGKAAEKPSRNGSNNTSTEPTAAVPQQAALCRAPATGRPLHAPSCPPPNANSFAGFGNSNSLMKFPGAVEPIWPPSGMTHIRGLENDPSPTPAADPSKLLKSENHKSKYTASEATANEDILNVIAIKLEINAVRKDSANRFNAPDRCLRVPERHFESGYKLQRRIRPQLKSAVTSGRFTDDYSEDELSRVSPGSSPHPVINKLFGSIPTTLSAFDKSQYQTQSWIHKYAPHSAAEVLQNGREAFILKEWLQSLTVIAVDTKVTDSSNTRASPGPVKAEKDSGGKKKRKSKKLEDFIVSSDDEANDMDEVSESDEESPRGGLGRPKKTVIRHGDLKSMSSKQPNKLLNAVVISGPNGCGKTAAVYAVAKELGFEVFAINSSSRRSGKDILEKVGDMTRNHLVQQTQEQKSDGSEDLQRASDALDADLKSGRQGTMKTFFKSTAPKAKEPKAKNAKPGSENTSHSTDPTPAKKPKQQKQSLILLEEVDILFEEDKQFWATVLTLISQSKRPIIMTCNDESLVLNQLLPLHAIIRFAPPPVDLAVDYMLLVAANEGHALKRPAVTALYKSQKFDLRATMTDLEFWCQIGVGDQRGGFDWFYPRLPAGIDKDSHGNTVRVVSEDTYRNGMGWLGRDSLCDPSGINDIEEEIIKQTWNGWKLDAGDWYKTLDLGSYAGKPVELSKRKRLKALQSYDIFTDAMSAADLCASGTLNSSNYILLDTTDPPISAKSLADLPIGSAFLAATPLSPPSLPLVLSGTLKSLARSYANSSLPRPIRTGLSPVTEPQLLTHITQSRSSPPGCISCAHYSLAFDPLGIPEKPLFPPPYLEASCVDRPMALLATDIAPYVRGIVACDARAARERVKAGNLVSEGERGKRPRTTRAAMAALWGGGRRVRREWWFEGVGVGEVERTGGDGWGDLVSGGGQAEEMVWSREGTV
ncbi:hypothetical protein VC83_05678 [Pseudogymnoascus destructans]|uniref:AAA+ ATPase domain-containing protein n=2 Tax=Pseudogymnoascus destructans TaxID=655981 RepID=L8FQ95_PSED2|nr:uncharacterized protein VC83_05678 [Pseudogymnoascus destructans]ELR03125.1 hypothetical protein GMDG_05958 [Pseudogymnoascus destructans 20631-21]OAF57700.1 hypothetical protein VC83_05678 [Pseudogymnoascus destructans]